MADKKPVRGQRAKTNATKAKKATTKHRIKHGSGPRVVGDTDKTPKALQRMRKAKGRNA